MKIVIETERLILREYTLQDKKELAKIIGDKETMKYYPAPYDANGVIKWINWNLDNYKRYGFGLWAIELKSTHEFIGDIGVTIQHINGRDLPELGFHIGRQYQRNGYSYEGGKAVLAYFFSHTKFRSIYCYQTKNNYPSQKAAMKLGFHFSEEYEEEGVIHTVYMKEKE